MIDRYKQILKDGKDFKPSEIKSFLPNPTEDEYKSGYIVRYFVQSTTNNKLPIYEVNPSGFVKYTSHPHFTTVELDWRLTGKLDEVKKSNRESVRIASQIIPKLKLYLPNLLQFYKK